MRRELAAIVLAAFAAQAHAQLVTSPDWREADAPPPPPVRLDRLVPIDMPGSELRYAVDGQSIQIGPDEVVRYVVVARSDSGLVNATYEGVRCHSAEVKVYARHAADSGWRAVKEPTWQSLRGNASVRHSLRLAQGGVCRNTVPNRSPEQIVRDLRASPESRFGSQTQ